MTVKELTAALQEELVLLWSDLDAARRRALVRNLDPSNDRSGWSIEMSNLADRIADITRLVGSPPWEKVSVDLLLEGWWDAVHRRAGLDAPPFDAGRAEAVLARRRG